MKIYNANKEHVICLTKIYQITTVYFLQKLLKIAIQMELPLFWLYPSNLSKFMFTLILVCFPAQLLTGIIFLDKKRKIMDASRLVVIKVIELQKEKKKQNTQANEQTKPNNLLIMAKGRLKF